MTAPASAPFVHPGSVAGRVLALVAVLGVVGAGTRYWVLTQPDDRPPTTTPATNPADDPAKPAAPTAKPFEIGGRPLFADWPKENPDLVIVVSGQTFGYLSPCGCSRPQYGGLERRYNLIQGLKAKGWDVIGVDAGDLAPQPDTKASGGQAAKKYEFAMKALAEMGYVAVGVGKTEAQNDLTQLLGKFALNNAGKRPVVLAANLDGVERNPAGQVTKTVPRADHFKGPPNSRPLVEDVEVVADRKVSVGVVGAIGPSVAAQIADADKSLHAGKPADALAAALKKLADDKAKPELKVLLYQGTVTEAQQVAKDHPDFQLVVRVGEDGEAQPRMFPEKVGNTQVVMVGHKGQYVGLVGVFKTDKGLDLRYQLVQLGEEYLTPEKSEEAAKANKALQLLEQYAREVKQDDLLKAATAKREPHAAAVQNQKANLKYVGSQACAKCHAAEAKKWGETKHSHAYDVLVTAKRPGLRQFDPDCVGCHTTGFDYATGFESEAKTKELLHNGCENCHGPGSGHAEKPKAPDLLKALTPWRLDPKDKLPPKEEIEAMGKIPLLERGKKPLDPQTQRLVVQIQQMCMRCHDGDNDPHFDFWTYFPKVHHSGLGGKSDLPGGVGK